MELQRSPQETPIASIEMTNDGLGFEVQSCDVKRLKAIMAGIKKLHEKLDEQSRLNRYYKKHNSC